jgi:pimeloyl-ACP methyl ester carboxylesterase
LSHAGLPAAADPILLLHGQPGSARDWDGVRTAIGEEANTVAIDRPGWHAGSSASDLAGNAGAAIAALDLHGIERATVVGHSFGGAVAAWLAAYHPERVGTLVLAAPSANVASLNRLDHILASRFVGPVLGAAALAGIGVALTTARLRRRIAAALALDDLYLQATGRASLTPATWRAFAIEQRTLIRDLPSLEPRLDQISAPTTIAIGTADRVVGVSAARRLAAQIPPAQLVLLEGADHLLPQRRAKRLAELIIAAASSRR